MCLQLTTNYGCGHTDMKLDHCPRYDRTDIGPHASPPACAELRRRTRDMLYPCDSCGRVKAREARDHQRQWERRQQERRRMRQMRQMSRGRRFRHRLGRECCVM